MRPAGASVAPSGVAFPPHLLGINECDKAQCWHWFPFPDSRRYRLANQVARHTRALIAKAAAYPCARPCMLDIFGEGPRRDPQRAPFLVHRSRHYQTSSWWYELRSARFLAIVVAVCDAPCYGISPIRPYPHHIGRGVSDYAAGVAHVSLRPIHSATGTATALPHMRARVAADRPAVHPRGSPVRASRS